MDHNPSMLQALHQGIQTELQGRTFYRRAAERCRDEKGRAAFESLIREEEMHLRLLKNQYGALTGEGGWLSMEQARKSEPGKPVEEIFPQDDETLARLLPTWADDSRALEIALEFEHKGYQSYQGLASQTTDEMGRTLFLFLAQQEQRHYEFISRALDYLKNQGAWYFDATELPFFEG
jgi:rubrerythrin